MEPIDQTRALRRAAQNLTREQGNQAAQPAVVQGPPQWLVVEEEVELL